MGTQMGRSYTNSKYTAVVRLRCLMSMLLLPKYRSGSDKIQLPDASTTGFVVEPVGLDESRSVSLLLKPSFLFSGRSIDSSATTTYHAWQYTTELALVTSRGHLRQPAGAPSQCLRTTSSVMITPTFHGDRELNILLIWSVRNTRHLYS